jgi:hypothetical protein
MKIPMEIRRSRPWSLAERAAQKVFMPAPVNVRFRQTPIVVFDDIRVWNMLAIWHDLRWPKLDPTSFGHWSGTGICEVRVET